MVTAFLASAGGQALMSGLGQGIGALGSIFGKSKDSASVAAARQYHYQRLLNQQQYDLTQQGYRESPLNQRIGYESAGVNPILAMSNGASFGSYSGGSASAPMDSTTSEMGSMLTNAYKTFALERSKNKAEILGINAGIKNTNADTALKAEQTMTERARQTQIEVDNAKTRLETDLAQKDLDYYDRRAKASLLEMLNRAEDYRVHASLQDYNAETQRINAMANAYEMNFREKHPVYNWVQRSAGVAGDLVGAGVSVYSAKSGRINAMANANNSYNNNGYERYTQRFDSKGNYRGHTREVYTKR